MIKFEMIGERSKTFQEFVDRYGKPRRALCKMRGQLVIVEVNYVPPGQASCPLCGCKEFREHQGWVECSECLDYALLESDL